MATGPLVIGARNAGSGTNITQSPEKGIAFQFVAQTTTILEALTVILSASTGKVNLGLWTNTGAGAEAKPGVCLAEGTSGGTGVEGLNEVTIAALTGQTSLITVGQTYWLSVVSLTTGCKMKEGAIKGAGIARKWSGTHAKASEVSAWGAQEVIEVPAIGGVGALWVRGGGQVQLVASVLRQLIANGGGNVKLAGTTPTASLAVRGGGALKLTGYGTRASAIKVPGGGQVKLTGYQKPSSSLSVHGGGNTRLTGARKAGSALRVPAGGNVSLLVKPAVRLQVSGGGQIVLVVRMAEPIEARIEIVNTRLARIEIVH